MKLHKKTLVVWQSPVFSHPEKTGSSSSYYELVHNQARSPMFCSLQDQDNISGALWHDIHYVENGGSGHTGFTYYGWQTSTLLSSNLNSTRVEIFRLQSGSRNVRVNLFFEG